MQEACSGTQAEDRTGILLDLITKLHNGSITYSEVKRFARRENPFKEKSDIKSNRYGELANRIGLVYFWQTLDLNQNVKLEFEDLLAIARDRSDNKFHHRPDDSNSAQQRLLTQLLSKNKTFEECFSLFDLRLSGGRKTVHVQKAEGAKPWEIEGHAQVAFELYKRMVELASTINHCHQLLKIEFEEMFGFNSQAELQTHKNLGQHEVAVTDGRGKPLTRHGKPVTRTEELYEELEKPVQHLHPCLCEFKELRRSVVEKATNLALTVDDWVFVMSKSWERRDLCLAKIVECANTIEDWAKYLKLIGDRYELSDKYSAKLPLEKIATLL